MIIGQRLKGFLKKHGFTAKMFAEMIDVSEAMVYKYYNMDNIDSDTLYKWATVLHVPIMLFIDDAVYNDMVLKDKSQNLADKYYNKTIELQDKLTEIENSRKLPLYDDVASVGGKNIVAEMQATYNPTKYIDVGDWFKDATALIRHTGESMLRYPSGCILALREVNDKTQIVWGNDYTIETNEFRITKRIQTGKDDSSISCYSTNLEKYPDGKLIHEPIEIKKEHITKMFRVLGYVVDTNGTLYFNSNK